MRILIELPTWLGDAVMASAAVEAIAKHASAAFGKENLAGKFDGSTREFDGQNSTNAGESERKFDELNLTSKRDTSGEMFAFTGDGESNFSFLTQTFGAVTQERQIFVGDVQAKGAANSSGEFDDKFDGKFGANDDANLTANARDLKDGENANFSANEARNLAPSEQNLGERFLKNSAQKSGQAPENLTAQILEPNLNLAIENQSPQNLQSQAEEPLKIVFFGSFAACELFKAHPNCERAIVDEGKKTKFRLWRLFGRAKSLGEFDAAFSFRSSFASKILLLGARAKRKFGFKKSKDGAHQVQKYLKFAKSALNLTRADDALRLYFEPRKFDAPVLGLNPGASYGSAKRWYPHYFAQVALRFKDRFRIVIFGGAGERDMCEQIEQILRENGATCENLAGKTSIRELCVNIGGIARGGGIFVTNDSGPMHVAAAYGTPTIALFGPTRFTKTCPWRNENARILHLNLACMPCMKRVCPLKTHACMKELSPQAVAETIEREFLKESKS